VLRCLLPAACQANLRWAAEIPRKLGLIRTKQMSYLYISPYVNYLITIATEFFKKTRKRLIPFTWPKWVPRKLLIINIVTYQNIENKGLSLRHTLSLVAPIARVAGCGSSFAVVQFAELIDFATPARPKKSRANRVVPLSKSKVILRLWGRRKLRSRGNMALAGLKRKACEYSLLPGAGSYPLIYNASFL
jgi:hypothetical protein